MPKTSLLIAQALLLAHAASAQLPTGVKFKPMLPAHALEAGEKKIWMGEIPGLPRHFFVLDMRGLIYHVAPEPGGSWAKRILADIRPEVMYGYAAGCGAWKIAFHPDFTRNGKFYLLYMAGADVPDAADAGGGPVRLEEWKAGGSRRDSVSRLRAILTYPHARANGVATLVFGRDGYLYVNFNDYAVDSQDLSKLGRKILRIDVDNRDPGLEYAVPPSNPFYHNSNPHVKEEIWAYGFRNLWSLYSDPATGDLWGADVGQSDYEEINLIRPAGNYGWGFGGEGVPDRSQWTGFSGPCPSGNGGYDCSGYTDPEYAFSWSGWAGKGFKCISGGFVYRGEPRSPFYGAVFMADVTLDHLVAMVRGGEPRLVGDAGEVAPGQDGQEGLVWLAHDSYWNVYAVFLGRRDFNIYILDHPDLAPLSRPVGTLEDGARRARLAVRLDPRSESSGPAYGLDGRRMVAPPRAAGLYLTPSSGPGTSAPRRSVGIR